MNAKYSFRIQSDNPKSKLPSKMVIGQKNTETPTHILLKFLSYLLFFRDRIQLETRLPHDHMPFTPDIAQLDYELHPTLWVECGECTVKKLDKLAVKVPEAEIWIVRRSRAVAEELIYGMKKGGLRKDRYKIIALDEPMLEEMEGLLSSRNDCLWVKGSFDPPELQFDFNGLWFDAPFDLFDF